jgi:nonsense-mediated mRNA decay protein 3
MFCVRCGREAPVTEGLCADCFRSAHVLAKLPQVVRVEVCSHCGARHRGGSWGDPLASVERAIEEELRLGVEPDRRVDTWRLQLQGEQKDPTNWAYEAAVTGTALGVPFEVRGQVVATVHRSTCTRCGRRSGGYYESILQLRAEDRAFEDEEKDLAGDLIERTLKGMHAAGDLDSFLVKAEAVRGGYDFYLGTVHAGRTIARALSEQLGASVKETASLVGRDRTGADLYRVTISVKLPRARLGGFVAEDEKLYEVATLSPKGATLTDLDLHKRITRSRRELDGMEVLPPSAAREAVVVSESDRELQVLDPETLRTEDVVKPPGFPPGRRSARVVRWAGRLWLLPAGPADRLT